MSMPELRYQEAPSGEIFAIRFGMAGVVDDVVTRLLEAVRPIDVCLLKVFGDENHVYPFEGRNPVRTASSWRAELYCGAGTRLERLLSRAERFLDCRGGVRLEAEER